MPFRTPKPQFHRRASATEEIVGRELLLGVWDINPSINVEHFAYPYMTYCNELRSLFEDDGLSQANRTDIVDLVKLVKRSLNDTIKEIEDGIRKAKFRWINPLAGDDSIHNILDFAIRLWLFIEPDLSNESLTLSEVVARCLPRHSSKNDESSPYLPVDFCEKSLTRKGGLKLEWTSYLPDHLTFAGKSRLRVFRHASAIQKYSKSATSLPYPPGFLQETERTLALLFDPLGSDTSKRTRRIERKNQVDLEAAINALVDSETRLDLRKYQYWQEHLRKIRKVYEDAQPKTLRQWWFDRRNRFNWATFWTAIVVFCITLIFGLISSVTGIMQVYAAFKALSPLPPVR